MKSNKLLCSCCLCQNVITSNNLPIHYNSKQCKTGKLFSSYKINDCTGVDCRYCGKTCKSINSKTQHELYCRSNPKKKQKVPSYGMVGKKGLGENQFTKAKKLGLPVPIVSAETRKKLSESNRNNPKSYSSKEGNAAIEKLLGMLTEYEYGKIKSFANDGEMFLTENRKKYFFYDLCFKDLGIIVEYQGTAFHPKSLDSNFTPPYRSMGSKLDVWKKDRLKEDLAKRNGFDIEYIWSDSVDNDIKRISEKVKTYCIQNKKNL
jgi:hypothetical protein